MTRIQEAFLAKPLTPRTHGKSIPRPTLTCSLDVCEDSLTIEFALDVVVDGL
jgi:hypothetical protein